MKRMLSMLLCGLVLWGTAAPAAAAEETAQDRLARVTQTVKDVLDLDTGAYDDFQGECHEREAVPVWTLRWEGEDRSLTVEALEDGTVVSFYLGESAVPVGTGQSFPAFPAASAEEAASAAEAFLAKVLDPPLVSARLEAPSGMDRLGSDSYTFSGQLLLHGLPSPLAYSITVRAADAQVIRFRRDIPEETFLGDIPAAQAAISQDCAAQTLAAQLGLTLEYVLPEAESTSAVLRYVPAEGLHTCYVDAADGSLIDLTALTEDLWSRENASGDSAAAAESGGGLSPAEQAGIEKLEGVLSSSRLDRLLREEAAYGLDRYALVSASYILEEAEADGEERVLCSLRYSRSGEDGTHGRTVTVDARTGQVCAVSSSAPWDAEGRAALTAGQAQARAESFLQTFCGPRWGSLALYRTDDRTGDGAPCYTFTFARQENGYFFPAHTYTVSIDRSDGSVYRLSVTYDDSVTFQDPAGIVSAEEALSAWMDTYDVVLAYRLVPVALDRSDPVQARLLEQGQTYGYALRLTYALEREVPCLGIDAKSGQPVWRTQETTGGLSYGDLSGSWARGEIEALARFGVGYAGGTFQPGKALTQWDLVCLLSSVRGLPLDPAAATEQERDAAYAAAYAMGALSREERADERLLTRSELVEMLLDSAGYGPVARLEGIFTCSYPDRAAIPADVLGYAALAQGLGLVRGDWAGTRTACRAEAAVMLCRLLDRPL